MCSEICNNNITYKELNDFEKGIDTYIDYLHTEFENFFYINKIEFNNKRIIVSDIREEDGRLERFWHIISRQQEYTDKQTRFPETSRCNALHYIPYITNKCINFNKCKNLLTFKRIEKKKKKVYLWCLDKNIMIVLEEMKNVYRFITCFIVRGKKNRDKYMKRYNEYKK